MAMANITVPIQVNLPDDWIEQIVNRLRNDPESEWVEIVRCKDCKYYVYGEDEEQYYCRQTGIGTEEDHYCAYGERREE